MDIPPSDISKPGGLFFLTPPKALVTLTVQFDLSSHSLRRFCRRAGIFRFLHRRLRGGRGGAVRGGPQAGGRT
jgi:hypothetical protein